MKAFKPLRLRLASRRAQHLVFLAHVWACAPFLLLWLMDERVRTVLGQEVVWRLQPVIGLTVVYVLVRTLLAWRDKGTMRWEYVFSPVDVLIVSLFLYLSHRGPMSNVSLLFFLPMVSAAGSLNVRFAAFIGLMVVAGTAFSTFTATDVLPLATYRTARELIQAEPLNASFRLYFLVVLSSLMAFQSLSAAEMKERLGVEADRNRIALDMHDGVQGHLITLAQQLELMARVAEKNPSRAAELAMEGRESTRKAADELRFLVQRLRSPALDQGFLLALRQYAHNVCTRHGLRLEFEVQGSEEVLNPEVENALFRIAQESLNNIVKHAEATLVTISVAFESREVRLIVTDNGRGFAVGKIEGVGLESIRHRAQMVGASVRFESAEGSGSKVCVGAPIRS